MTMSDRAPKYPEVGESFGSWVFVAPGHGYSWKMRCVCGTEREIRSQDIRQGASKSCGCVTPRGLGGFKNKTHGQDYGNKLYRTWRNAKNRCFNPSAQKFDSYGAAGITMCPEWAESFEAFAAYLGEAPTPLHSIDRIDNTKGYEPGNVRWATAKEQVNNRKNTIRVQHEGKTVTLEELSVLCGIRKSTLAARRISGWPDEYLPKPVGFRLSKELQKVKNDTDTE